LLGIATNVCRNVRRAARRYDVALTRLPRDDAVPDPADEVAGRVDDREELALIGKAMAALRQNEREVLALCVWSGLDYAEAAAALGVPVGTVRSRLSRVRKKLRALVDKEKRLELRSGDGQVTGDGAIAVRPVQENAR
jgi:RNA polymerase sigma-70 factor (ECF subfamily)